MASTESPEKELDAKYVDNIVKFVSDIRNGKLEGSNNIALTTVTLLEEIINDSKNASAYELLRIVRAAGQRLARALPGELVAANMVRRVLKAIRDECQQQQSGDGGGLQRLVLAAPSRRATLGPHTTQLAEPLREHLAELRLELESSASSIASTAREHVHADELILTAGASRLVEGFLRHARRSRLILAEGVDTHKSHAMARRLAAGGVAVTVISNAAVHAVMSRVNKVVLGVRAALAGGALLADAGAMSVAAAARMYSVPLIALSPLYKLSPTHACDQQHLYALRAPHSMYESSESSAAHVLAPQCDFIPPDHVALLITNLGGSSPSYIYRLLSELYDPSDYDL